MRQELEVKRAISVQKSSRRNGVWMREERIEERSAEGDACSEVEAFKSTAPDAAGSKADVASLAAGEDKEEAAESGGKESWRKGVEYSGVGEASFSSTLPSVVAEMVGSSSSASASSPSSLAETGGEASANKGEAGDEEREEDEDEEVEVAEEADKEEGVVAAEDVGIGEEVADIKGERVGEREGERE